MEGVVVFTNPSFVPLYIPPMTHEVAVEGKKCCNAVKTRATAVAPSSSASQFVNLRISSADLPELALHPLAKGGPIDIRVVSGIPLGDYSPTKTTDVEIAVSRPLSSY